MRVRQGSITQFGVVAVMRCVMVTGPLTDRSRGERGRASSVYGTDTVPHKNSCVWRRIKSDGNTRCLKQEEKHGFGGEGWCQQTVRRFHVVHFLQAILFSQLEWANNRGT